MASQHDPANRHPDKSKSHANHWNTADDALSDAPYSEVVSHKVSRETWQIDDTGTEAQRRERIAKAAYFRAERRGFEPGHEAEDWAAAELEVGAEDSNQSMLQT